MTHDTQHPFAASSPVLEYVATHRQRYLDELSAFLRIPSISADPAYAEEVVRCAEFLAERLRGAGLTRAEVFPTAGHPVVYGEWLGAGPAAPTFLVYGHYDVQPADPLELWDSPPFEPRVVDGRIVARGASDDKGQLYCHIKGVEAHLATSGRLPVNVKFLLEGEEEVGSTHLPGFLEAHRELLAADAVFISDTAMLRPGQPSITYALRGLAYLQVDVRGPSHDLHSGVYGGSVENPIQALCRMLAGLVDDSGRIAIPGFYDTVRPLSAGERAELAAIGFDEDGFIAASGAPCPVGEEGFTTLERVSARPSLDVCGIWGGYSGEGAKTVLPAEAHAKVSVRLVPDQDPDVVADLLALHLQASAPKGVTVSVERMHGGHPAWVDRSDPAVRAAVRALERTFGAAPVFIREGGSIPIVTDFQRVLGVQSVLMGFGLNDDRIHSPNEKLDLAQFFGGIGASALLWEEAARREPSG